MKLFYSFIARFCNKDNMIQMEVKVTIDNWLIGVLFEAAGHLDMCYPKKSLEDISLPNIIIATASYLTSRDGMLIRLFVVNVCLYTKQFSYSNDRILLPKHDFKLMIRVCICGC